VLSEGTISWGYAKICPLSTLHEMYEIEGEVNLVLCVGNTLCNESRVSKSRKYYRKSKDHVVKSVLLSINLVV